jgi:hypothetical protein
MTRRRSKARLRVAFFGAILFLLNAAILAAVTWPRLTRVRRSEERAAQVAKRRAELEAVWTRLTARRELVEKNRADIERLGSEYLKPRATDLFAAQREIEALAKASGLKPKQSAYTIRAIKGTDLVRCEVGLPLDGSYANLTAFLSRVETTKRFLLVDELKLNREDAGARMSLTLWALFREGGERAP